MFWFGEASALVAASSAAGFEGIQFDWRQVQRHHSARRGTEVPQNAACRRSASAPSPVQGVGQVLLMKIQLVTRSQGVLSRFDYSVLKYWHSKIV